MCSQSCLHGHIIGKRRYVLSALPMGNIFSRVARRFRDVAVELDLPYCQRHIYERVLSAKRNFKGHPLSNANCPQGN